MSTFALPTMQELTRALEAQVPEAHFVGLWLSEDRRGPRLDLVYAYDAFRLAGLRHWTQEREWFQRSGASELPVVAWEAATLSRLGLKGHPRYDALQARTPALDPHGLLAAMPPCCELSSPGERFAPLEAWLQRVRRTVP